MKPEKFNQLRDQAVALHKSQPARPAADRLSLDAIFTALAAADGGAASVRKTSEEPAPAWFTATFDKLQAAGESFTVSRFLILAGRFPVTRSDQANVGRWLREAGLTPRKTGGQILFEFGK